MKPLKLDADSSRTGKLEDMNAPWSRLLHLATRYTYPKRYPLVLAGDAMFDFYYLAKGRLRIMHGAENGRERAMVYIGSGNVFNEATALAGFDDPDCRFYCMEDVELYRFPGTLLHDPRFVAEYPELIINLMVSMSTKVLVMHANLSETGGGTAVKQASLFLCGLSRLHGDTGRTGDFPWDAQGYACEGPEGPAWVRRPPPAHQEPPPYRRPRALAKNSRGITRNIYRKTHIIHTVSSYLIFFPLFFTNGADAPFS